MLARGEDELPPCSREDALAISKLSEAAADTLVRQNSATNWIYNPLVDVTKKLMAVVEHLFVLVRCDLVPAVRHSLADEALDKPRPPDPCLPQGRHVPASLSVWLGLITPMQNKIANAILCLCLMWRNSASAESFCPEVTPINFMPGAKNAEISGGVPRGHESCWSLKTKVGQTIKVVIKSVENNAVFEIYQPGWKFKSDGDIEGQLYKGFYVGDEIRSWSGYTEISGDNLFVVGSIRGGVSYTLTIKIDP